MTKQKSNIKLPLNAAEKSALKRKKVKLAELYSYAPDEWQALLEVTEPRLRELLALYEFQTIPSIGIRFAEDLVFLGYFSLEDLKHKDGAALTNDYERQKGYWIDPCVEDQFRLVVYYANTRDASKKWWDFTQARKDFRNQFGYPADRPQKAWHETLGEGK